MNTPEPVIHAHFHYFSVLKFILLTSKGSGYHITTLSFLSQFEISSNYKLLRNHFTVQLPLHTECQLHFFSHLAPLSVQSVSSSSTSRISICNIRICLHQQQFCIPQSVSLSIPQHLFKSHYFTMSYSFKGSGVLLQTHFFQNIQISNTARPILTLK